MAKHNKQRKQAAQKQGRSSAEEDQERMQGSTAEQPQSKAQGSPTDVARKQQRRFGHN